MSQTLKLIALALMTMIGGLHTSLAAKIIDGSSPVILIGEADPLMKPGDLYYSINSQNIRMSIIQITMVRGLNAEAKALKGRASRGERLVKRILRTAPQSQPTASRKNLVMRFGLGISSFTFRGDGYSNSRYPIGFAASALAEFKIGGILFETGLKYYQAGAQFSLSNVDYDFTLNYLGIPMLVKFSVFESESVVWRAKTGVMISQAMSAKLKATFNGRVVFDSNGEANDKIDYLLVGGIECFVPTESGYAYFFDLLLDFGVKQFQSSSSNLGPPSNLGVVLLAGLAF